MDPAKTHVDWGVVPEQASISLKSAEDSQGSSKNNVKILHIRDMIQ